MAVAVDDATKPVDNDSVNSPAAEGAGEFRALKGKLNSAFLNTGVDATFSGLIDTNTRGWNVQRTNAAGSIQYASRFVYARSGGVFDTYGIWGEASINDGVSAAGKVVSGVSSVTKIGTGSNVGFVYGFTSIIYQQNVGFAGSCFGIQVVFADRLTSGIAAPGGLGANAYNKNAAAMFIDSFPRSSAGEFCGWKNGILFSAGAMDNDNAGAGYCFDCSALTYRGGTDPFAAYWARAAIHMREFQGIVFDLAGGIIQYMDAVTGRLTFSNGPAKKFEIDMNTGAIYRAGVIVP